MKTITKIQTFDFAEHDSVADAKRHLERLYGDILCKLGREVGTFNYTGRCEYLDNNLASFVQLAKIKADMEWDKLEDDSHD